MISQLFHLLQQRHIFGLIRELEHRFCEQVADLACNLGLLTI